MSTPIETNTEELHEILMKHICIMLDLDETVRYAGCY